MTYISAARRKKAATIHVDGKDKYPIDSKQTAKSAVKLIGRAKPPLTDSQKATVRRRAAEYGVKSKKPASPSKKAS